MKFVTVFLLLFLYCPARKHSFVIAISYSRNIANITLTINLKSVSYEQMSCFGSR